MADVKKKFVLHYGGQEFDLPESQKDVIDDIGDATGTIKMNLGGGSWLTIVTGPGIPIAVTEREVKPVVVRRVR